jgi:hypothetical protein
VRDRILHDEIDCDWLDATAFTYALMEDNRAAIEQDVEAASVAGLAVDLTTETELPFPVAAAVSLKRQGQFIRANTVSVSSTPFAATAGPSSSTRGSSTSMRAKGR